MSSIRLTHFSIVFQSLGGVESVLRHHYQNDHKHELCSRFVIYNETKAEPLERVCFLGYNAHTTIRQARHRLTEAVAAAPPEIAVHHGMWGMPYLADLDQAARRILMLHGDVPEFQRQLRARADWVDGVLCVSQPLRELTQRSLPHLGPNRVGFVPYPVSPPSQPSAKDFPVGRPLVLGFCGRLIVEQKRVDRLPAFCAQLDRAGLDYRLEFLGDGPERSWLERCFVGGPKFTFHGRKAGEDYWRIVNGWDVIFFTSDYEGTPIALLEAMSVGAIPIYPRIGSGGDAYAQSVRADLLYAPGDFAHVARTLQQLRGLPPARPECPAPTRPTSRGSPFGQQLPVSVRRLRAGHPSPAPDRARRLSPPALAGGSSFVYVGGADRRGAPRLAEVARPRIGGVLIWLVDGASALGEPARR